MAMSDFDFFGVEGDDGDNNTPDEMVVSADFDYSHVLNDQLDKNVKLCVSVKPSDELRKSFDESGGAQNAHICLMIDTSDSMNIIVDNTNAVSTGRTMVGEDGQTYNIVEGGISKLHIAKASAKKIADLLRPGDTLDCIAYDETARCVFSNYGINERSEILNQLDNVYGKGMQTNISGALLMADRLLGQYTDALPKRVLFFTDGEPTGDDTEEKGIAAGQQLANHNIAIESMGFGNNDVNFPYLQKISSASGGITSLISYPDEFASVFSSMFTQSQSIIVTNVKLIIKLVGNTKIHDYYRGTPDNVYLGNNAGSESRTIELNLGQIEKNQTYKYYFNVMVPGQDGEYEGPINTMSAELHYYVPGRYNDSERTTKINIPIQVTADSSLAGSINGDINTLFRLAEVKRFDEEREKAFNSGDKEATVKWIRKIIQVYTELQKPVEIQAYTEMLDQYMKTNNISKAVLNKATSSSSQAQDTGILEDLEDAEMSKFADRLKNRRKH